MRFFLDENLSVVAIEPLGVIFRGSHSFQHAGDLGLLGVDDIELYPRLRDEGIDAIVSKDGRQLKVQAERRGLYEAGLTFIHLGMGKSRGRIGLALELAALTAGIPYIEQHWSDEPWAYRIRGLQSGFSERVAGETSLWMDSWGAKPR